MEHNYGNHPSFLLFSPAMKAAAIMGRLGPRPITSATRAVLYPLRLAMTPPRTSRAARPSRSCRTRTACRAACCARLTTARRFGWAAITARRWSMSIFPFSRTKLGQWCAYPDFDVIREFTGYLRPGNYDIFRYSPEQQGSFRWIAPCFRLRFRSLPGRMLQGGDRGQFAHAGAVRISVARISMIISGRARPSSEWSTPSGSPKAMSRRTNFAGSAGPTVPLARLTKRIFTNNESLDSDVEIYNFADTPFSNAKPYWRVVDLAGQVAAQGDWPARDIPIGKNIPARPCDSRFVQAVSTQGIQTRRASPAPRWKTTERCGFTRADGGRPPGRRRI